MKSSPEATLTLQDLPRLFTKYWRLIIIGTFLCTALFTVAAYKLPKKYKTHFVLTIYTKYFQSPLIGDFVPELSESGEMRSQRESLIRQVLSPAYLDSLGEKYGIYQIGQNRPTPLSWYQKWRTALKTWCVAHGLYQPANAESQLSAERQDLLSRIEISSLNNTTFNVSFIYSDAGVTYRVTRDIYNQVIQSMLEIRKHTIANIRDAINARLGSLQSDLASSPAPSTPTRLRLIQEDLAEVRNQISVLSSQYTEAHPRMQELRARERLFMSRLNKFREDRREEVSIPVNHAADGVSKREINSDLMRKLNYLNIAMESDQQHQADYFATLESPLYPAAPLWPKKGLFALWGLAVGLFGSLFIAGLREHFDRSALHADALAEELGVPLLGKLPVFPWKTHLPTSLIDAPLQKPPGRN